MIEQDRILQLLRTTGPTLPTKVAKVINTQILFASAHLSDLASQGKVRISYLKIGGSPLYYLPGQESQLYPFASGNVNPKDLQVLDKLKEEKVLRENNLDLLYKVSLRSLRDFAVPLQVNIQGRTELFWKWHLLSEEETNKLIAKLLSASLPEKAEETKIEEKVEKKVSKQLISVAEEKPLPLPTLSEKKEEPISASMVKPEQQKTLVEEKNIPESPEEPKKSTFQKFKEKILPRKRNIIEDNFLPQVENLFKKLKVEIEQKELLRKNAELTLIVKVPSVVGKMTYFCKAKNKNKCDEKDLSSAYMEAQIKKLPLLFLYSNEINKKAQEMLDSGAFQNVIVKKIE